MTGFPQPSMPGFVPGPQGYGQSTQVGYGPRGPADDQLWSLLAYLLGFVASILAPLIIYLVKMNESRYVRYHAAQALNMGITMVIYAFGAFFVALAVALVTHGFGFLILIPVYLALGIAHLVYLILAAIGAHRGELYRVPTFLALPMVR